MSKCIRLKYHQGLSLPPMKHFLALITMIAMIAQTFHMGIIEADFFINQKQITEELCENKDKPQMECAGHCQLKKELEKNNQSHSQERVPEMTVFIGENSISIEKPSFLRSSVVHSPKVLFTSQDYLSDIFHPPSC